MLKDELKWILNECNSFNNYHDHNKQLFEINEGDLLKYVAQDLKNQMQPKSFNAAKHRIAAINILRRLIDKLSKIYSTDPLRVITPDSEQNKLLLSFYEKEMDLNVSMTQANRFFNLFKNTVIEPYWYKGYPKLRIIPSDRFIMISKDPIDPLNPTHYVKYMYNDDRNRRVFYIYTDQEFLIVNSDGEVLTDLMAQYGNPDGINVYGKIPAVYVNKSNYEIMPRPDSDLLSMVKLFPVLFTDVNFSVMFQTFSITYGVDVDFDNIEMAPNAFWSIKSDATSDKTPQIGTIKPEADISVVMAYIGQLLTTWLNTRNIRAGSIGTLTQDNFASGVSKIIDEMDAAEDRKEQISHFTKAESEMWDLIINYMHPVWRTYPDYGIKLDFAPGSYVTTEFQSPKMVQSQDIIIANQEKLLQLGLTTRAKAAMSIFEMTEEEAEEHIEKVDEENVIEVETKKEPMEPVEDADQE